MEVKGGKSAAKRILHARVHARFSATTRSADHHDTTDAPPNSTKHAAFMSAHG